MNKKKDSTCSCFVKSRDLRPSLMRVPKPSLQFCRYCHSIFTAKYGNLQLFQTAIHFLSQNTKLKIVPKRPFVL